MFYINKIEVPFWEKWYYFWEHKLKSTYDSWMYLDVWFWKNKWFLLHLSLQKRSLQIFKHDGATKDNINLKINATLEYDIININTFIENFLKYNDYNENYNLDAWEIKIRNDVSLFLNLFLSHYSSIEISENKSISQNIDLNILNEKLNTFWIHINSLSILDMQFPKKVQEMFAKRLETTLKSVIDLENARTAISTARALKNASKMLQEDDGTKFLYYLETISKIANSWWKHTFNIWKNDL